MNIFSPERNLALPIAGTILGISLIIGTAIVARTFVVVKSMDNVITVSGSAKKEVRADSAKWNGSFSRVVTVFGMAAGYAQMKADEQAVTKFLTDQGVPAENIVISPIFANEIWKNDNNAPKEYNLIQNVAVRLDDVDKMTALAKASSALSQRGVIFSAGMVEYYYQQLPELRIALLPDAIADAKKRVEAIATSSGKTVDSVKSVSMGVVQVMPAGTVDVSDYGMYDTASIDKEIMVTVKTTFSLK
ncbi:MAG: SIMPL domain-containing protein [Candidatus Yonathbacteria bacterium]|nr:SIMPL domain-containing protein [Candidatus Yonathbacteria bacterium]